MSSRTYPSPHSRLSTRYSLLVIKSLEASSKIIIIEVTEDKISVIILQKEPQARNSVVRDRNERGKTGDRQVRFW